jgi:hypothetical protein
MRPLRVVSDQGPIKPFQATLCLAVRVLFSGRSCKRVAEGIRWPILAFGRPFGETAQLSGFGRNMQDACGRRGWSFAVFALRAVRGVLSAMLLDRGKRRRLRCRVFANSAGQEWAGPLGSGNSAHSHGAHMLDTLLAAVLGCVAFFCLLMLGLRVALETLTERNLNYIRKWEADALRSPR